MYGLRIPDAVLLDQRLAPDAKLVYGLLAASGPSFNPSIRQISRSLGMSSKRVVPAIRALEARGVVTAGRPRARVREDGSRRFKEATRYTVHAGAKPDVWVRPHRVQSFLEATEGQSRASSYRGEARFSGGRPHWRALRHSPSGLPEIPRRPFAEQRTLVPTDRAARGPCTARKESAPLTRRNPFCALGRTQDGSCAPS
jgi:hypothetical protein